MKLLQKIDEMTNFCPSRQTDGLSRDVICTFIGKDSNLVEAINSAYEAHVQWREEFGCLMKQPEECQINAIQKDYMHFYSDCAINPYIPAAAKGPWIVSTCGAVIHDSGGYGMLGFGHSPTHVLASMNRPHVMANIMTANFAQKKLIEALRVEIGHTRVGAYRHPFQRFLCLNSGSEAITVATRISDIHAKKQVDPHGKHKGKTIKFLSLEGCFHGRTDRPAQLSHSCVHVYKEHLASFQKRDNLVTIEPNNMESLRNAFENASNSGVYFEAMFLEPVMGEGNPGLQVTPEFYSLARKLCTEHETLLVVDSIQAGLRAHGCLSIVDYSGFQELDPPDMESYSKALNAGQYPLSILAVSQEVAEEYVTGLYGNTMTTNPRALEVALSVLNQVTPSLRENIREKGKEFLTKLSLLKSEFPNLVGHVQGTGLLFSVAMRKDKIVVFGESGLEYRLRLRGIGVIHGGENSLRFTPHFWISSDEINLIISVLREQLKGYEYSYLLSTNKSKVPSTNNREQILKSIERELIEKVEETKHATPRLDEIKDIHTKIVKEPDGTFGEINKLFSYKLMKATSEDNRADWEANKAAVHTDRYKQDRAEFKSVE